MKYVSMLDGNHSFTLRNPEELRTETPNICYTVTYMSNFNAIICNNKTNFILQLLCRSPFSTFCLAYCLSHCLYSHVISLYCILNITVLFFLLFPDTHYLLTTRHRRCPPSRNPVSFMTLINYEIHISSMK